MLLTNCSMESKEVAQILVSCVSIPWLVENLERLRKEWSQLLSLIGSEQPLRQEIGESSMAKYPTLNASVWSTLVEEEEKSLSEPWALVLYPIR